MCDGESRPAAGRLLELIQQEYERQDQVLQLVASENLPTPYVLGVLRRPLLAFKTAEGLPGARYHGGCDVIDRIERLAQEEARKLFGAVHVNVQTNTASVANQAALRALNINKGLVLHMDVRAGGHIGHGNNGWARTYGVSPKDFRLDYTAIKRVALDVRPAVIIAGSSSYPREIDFGAFREIADKVDAYLLADIAHTAGFVASGIHQSPVDCAHITTASTYKTLRGPRSGVLLVGAAAGDEISGQVLSRRVDTAVFPGTQGSPNVLSIAAKAACFAESQTEGFRQYILKVRANAKALVEALIQRGHTVVTGGSDCHIVLVDLTSLGCSGAHAQRRLSEAGIVCNKNLIPFDQRGARSTSGVRLGTAFLTSRGLGTREMSQIADLFDTVLRHPDTGTNSGKVKSSAIELVREQVRDLARQFPLQSGKE